MGIMKYCRNCGAMIPEGRRFCSSCGTPVAAAPPVPPGIPAQPVYQNVAAPPAPIPLTGPLPRPAAITIFSILNFIYGILFFAGTAILVSYGRRVSGDVSTWLIVLGIAGVAAGILPLVCATGLWRMRRYGKALLLFFAGVGILGFPVYTIISVLLFIYLFKPEINILFSGKRAQELTPAEMNTLASLPRSQPIGMIAAIGLAVVTLATIAACAMMAGSVAFPGLMGPAISKEKQTMADMRSIGTAVEAYAVDKNAYPAADSMEALAKDLEPIYIKELPRKDAWGTSFRYRADQENDVGPQNYILVSAGSDGVLEHQDLQGYTQRATKDLSEDIVFSVGSFTQYPESIKQ